MKNFLNSIKKGFFPFIIAFSALSVSASAAFYSVSGLSKLFAGASFEVIIMAGSLEVAKLIIASLLYQYWSTINKLLKIYLSIATIILVLITSMGIYGFLSAAYQDTYRQLTIKENQVSFLDQKKQFYEKDVIRYDQELERISNNISTLSNAKVSNIQVRDTSVSSGFRQTISTTELRLSQKRIEVEEENRQKVQTKREVAADSLQKYQFEILDLENNAGVAGELGPLQYLSGLTGIPMDKIINILLLTIIFVFDPLAISLVIAANFAFAQAFPKREEDVLSVFDNDEKWDDGIDEAINLAEEAQDKINKENKNFNLGDWDEDKGEKRMNIIGRNGNDGEHYEELSNKYEDTSVEIRTLKDKLSSIDEYLDKNAPYYGKKSEVTKSVDEPIIENKLRSAPKTPYNPGYDISEDHRDQDDAKTY
tara:strand:- start:106 stop:1374 length:1269 start_codon:yes stop_codon:yes gene_type:complete